MKRSVGVMATVLGVTVLLSPPIWGQSEPAPVRIPPNAIALEGIPTARVESAKGNTTRSVLNEAESLKSRLVVKIIDGEYYWTSRDNRRLRAWASGAYTYLSSEPGQYIRFKRANDKFDYVEHLDMPFGYVRWWGELRIVLEE